MASIIDQFRSMQVQSSLSKKSFIGTEAFKNFKLDRDPSIFSKLKINFVPSYPIINMVVCNGHIIIAMSNMVIMLIDLLKPNEIKEIDVKKYSTGNIKEIFMDPTGKHLIINILSSDTSIVSETLYLHWDSYIPKVCHKLKGMLVTAVGWDIRNITEATTGSILIGTQSGFIYEIELTTEEGLFNNSCEKYFKLLHEMKSELSISINRIDIMECSANDLLYIVFCSTPSKIHQFVGCSTTEDKPFFGPVFKNSSSKSSNFLELSLSSSWGSIFQFERQIDCMAPHSYAYIAEQEIHLGELDWSSHIDDMSNNRKTYTHPKIFEGLSPCGFVATQFHLLIVYPSKVQALCTLNNQVIFEEYFAEECGQIVGITEDILNKTVWVYSEKGVFKYKITDEERNVWRIYLEQGKYDLAKKYCKNDNERVRHILFKEADDLLSKKLYIKAAMTYSRIPVFLEDICLKLLEIGAEEALKVYLKEKLIAMTVSDQTQIYLIVLWLLEIHLKELGIIRDTEGKTSLKYKTSDQEFKEFLRNKKVKLCITQNSHSVYNLLSSHDDEDNYVAIAVILKDFNKVVRFLISHQRYHEALEVMATQGSEELFYQQAPTLLQHIPKETVQQLIIMGDRLNPMILLPNLVHIHATHGYAFEVMEYVEHCINELQIKEQAMHNFIITLYCEKSPEKLIEYLQSQGDIVEDICYDVKFALRECSTAGHETCSIHVLVLMNLFLEAVELALKTNVDLAKDVAKRAKHNEALCKELWLMIAARVIKEDQSIQKAMDILKECPLLKIEDVLPFFPDFVTINEFKSAICSSLQAYNEQIEALKEDMEESTKVANQIRNSIKQFKQSSSIVRSFDKCNECGFPLMNRSFYLFNCSHKFHHDCLSESVRSFLPEAKQKTLGELQRKLDSLSSGALKKPSSNIWSDREQIRQKINNIVAAECLYCGELAINNIDTPFIPKQEWDIQITDWL